MIWNGGFTWFYYVLPIGKSWKFNGLPLITRGYHVQMEQNDSQGAETNIKATIIITQIITNHEVLWFEPVTKSHLNHVVQLLHSTYSTLNPGISTMWSASLPSQNPFVTTPRHRSLHTEFHSPNIHPPSPGTRRNRSHPWNRLGRPWPCHGAVSSSGPAAEAAAGCGTRPASRGAPDPVGATAATRGTGSGAEAAPGGAASLVDYMKSRGVSPKSLRPIFLRLQKLVEFWSWRSSEELLLFFWRPWVYFEGRPMCQESLDWWLDIDTLLLRHVWWCLSFLHVLLPADDPAHHGGDEMRSISEVPTCSEGYQGFHTLPSISDQIWHPFQVQHEMINEKTAPLSTQYTACAPSARRRTCPNHPWRNLSLLKDTKGVVIPRRLNRNRQSVTMPYFRNL